MIQFIVDAATDPIQQIRTALVGADSYRSSVTIHT